MKAGNLWQDSNITSRNIPLNGVCRGFLMSGFLSCARFSLSGTRCVACRPGSLIGFELIARRSGPHRQSQASKSSAKPQKPQGAAARQMERDKLLFPLLVFCFPMTRMEVNSANRQKSTRAAGGEECFTSSRALRVFLR